MLALTASCSRHASIAMTFSNGQAGSPESGLMTMSSRANSRTLERDGGPRSDALR